MLHLSMEVSGAGRFVKGHARFAAPKAPLTNRPAPAHWVSHPLVEKKVN